MKHLVRELLTALYLDVRRPTYAQVAREMGRSIGGIGPLRGRCLSPLRQLAALRRKLSEEGLFEPQSRLPRPVLPRTIGIVTGGGAYAERVHAQDPPGVCGASS